VKIISAGGVEVRRRRLEDLAIEFEIQSPAGADAKQADKLKENLGTVATSGALVANVQKSAADAGVLVAGLKNMPVVLAAPLVVVTMKSVIVFERQRPEDDAVVDDDGTVIIYDTCEDLTMNDGSAWEDGFTGCSGASCGPFGLFGEPLSNEACCRCGGGSDGTAIYDDEVTIDDDMSIILGGVFGGLAALLVCVFFAARSGSSGAGEPTLTPKGQQDQTRV
jgi:hypothetical protein